MSKHRHEVWGFSFIIAITVLMSSMPAVAFAVEDMTPVVAEPIEPAPLGSGAVGLPVPEPSPQEPSAAHPEPVQAEAEAPVPSPSPETPVAQEQATPDEVDPDEAAHEAALESPTKSLETYEDARLERIHRNSIPDWGFNFTLAPKAFRNADLRMPISSVDLATENPSLMGILFRGERMILTSPGLLSVGLQGGGYGSTKKDPFKGLMPGILSLGPYAQYQANYLRRQILVPTAAFQYEFVRYGYSYNNKNIRGFRGIPRLDLGVMLFLNILEPSSAGQMLGNYGIRRTYLHVALSIATDSSKQDLDFSERGLRAGIRFEY